MCKADNVIKLQIRRHVEKHVKREPVQRDRHEFGSAEKQMADDAGKVKRSKCNPDGASSLNAKSAFQR